MAAGISSVVVAELGEHRLGVEAAPAAVVSFQA
jgi:hypothetical protein